MCVYKVMIYGILGRFINTKLTERPQNDIKLTIVMTIIHIHLLSFSSFNPS